MSRFRVCRHGRERVAGFGVWGHKRVPIVKSRNCPLQDCSNEHPLFWGAVVWGCCVDSCAGLGVVCFWTGWLLCGVLGANWRLYGEQGVVFNCLILWLLYVVTLSIIALLARDDVAVTVNNRLRLFRNLLQSKSSVNQHDYSGRNILWLKSSVTGIFCNWNFLRLCCNCMLWHSRSSPPDL